MNAAAWDRFAKARERCRSEIARLQKSLPELQELLQKFVDSRSPSYRVDTPVVYNGALDDVTRDSEIRLILVGDNPGRREQAAENRRYLVGPSGKIAEKFFRENPALGIDFRANVIILNKTPIHTPRTVELRELCKLGGSAFAAALAESQRIMARLLGEFQQAGAGENGAALPVWITGYSEMKKGGVFEAYTNELKRAYGGSASGGASSGAANNASNAKSGAAGSASSANGGDLSDTIFLYRHFSMNQFTTDLKRQALPGEPLAQALGRIGRAYRQRFLF